METSKETVRKMFSGLDRGNAEAFLAALADDVSWTIMGTTKFSGTFRGKEDAMRRLLAPLMEALEGGLALTPDSFVAEGDTVVVQARGKARTRTGKPYNNSYCQIFRLSDGKVKEIIEYLDTDLVNATFGK